MRERARSKVLKSPARLSISAKYQGLQGHPKENPTLSAICLETLTGGAFTKHLIQRPPFSPFFFAWLCLARDTIKYLQSLSEGM